MPVLREVAHHDQHLADELRVERRRDLVEEHHVRLHHQRPRDRHPLLLPARELVRDTARAFSSSPTRASSSCALRLGLRARPLADPARGEREVVDHAQMRKEVELLEDDADPLADAPRRRRLCA